MDIEELKTFITLAECKSFTKTAEIQHIVQSTVSNRIHSLEEYVGTQLVVRDKKGISLTAEGKIYLEYAKRIRELNHFAIHEMHMLKNYDDRLNVACVQWMFDYLTKDYLRTFAISSAKIAVNITIAHSEDIIPLLQEQLYDFAVLAYKIHTANLINVPFAESDIIFAGSIDRYRHLKNGIRKKDLAGLPLIYSDIWQNYLSEISENVVTDRRIFKIHCNMLNSAKDFCIAGAGLCFFPEIIVHKDISEGRLIKIPIKDLPVKRFQTYLVYNRQRMNSTAIRQWLNLFPELSPQ